MSGRDRIKPAAMKFKSVMQTELPQGRNGKHKKIVLELLSDIARTEFSKIEPVLKSSQTALLLLAEDNDRAPTCVGCEHRGSFIVRWMGPFSSMPCAEWREASCCSEQRLRHETRHARS